MVAAQIAMLPILPPYLQPIAHRFTDGANFASAGAGVLAQTHPGTVCRSFSILELVMASWVESASPIFLFKKKQ